MIDEKRLEELEEGGCLIPKPGVAEPSCHEYSLGVCDCERQELVRLARLGLWSEQHGIPALKLANEAGFKGEGLDHLGRAVMADALAALPKGER